MKITVVGTGYVGLVSGTCFAHLGHKVTCVDIDRQKIAALKAAKAPIYEPGLEKILAQNIQEGRLKFTTNLQGAVKDTDVIFLALPTPPGANGAADLSFVLDVAKKLGPMLKKYTIIVDKSTVPVGTSKLVKKAIAKNTKAEFDVVSNPEFLREGKAVEDTLNPDRIVIGSRSARAKKIMTELYHPFSLQNNCIIFMDEESAEMTKYAANAMLATRISFMNEIANMCDLVGANVDAVREGIGSDRRIGHQWLLAGIGYGGSCFPKDVAALRKSASQYGYDSKILNAVEQINQAQKQRLVEKILHYYKNDLQDKTFALWGLSFKPETDDIREAPALEIASSLIGLGAKIVAYDPKAMDNVKKLHPNLNLRFAKKALDAVKSADALIIATEWPEFRSFSWQELKNLLRSPVIFDGRNVFALEDVRQKGFYYESIGRQVVHG